MAKDKITAPVQSEVKESVAATAPVQTEAQLLQAQAEARAKARSETLASQTFPEAFNGCFRSARWHDVLDAANRFAPYCEEAAKGASDGKPTAIARKAATVAPSIAMEFRFALASYSLSGRTANATQLAELSQKLPFLATGGKLKDRAVTFGGIVLPPIAGEM